VFGVFIKLTIRWYTFSHLACCRLCGCDHGIVWGCKTAHFLHERGLWITGLLL